MEKQVDPNSLEEKLYAAATSHQLEDIKRLLKQGANINYVKVTDSDGWYPGNTHTALYSAVHSDFKGDQKNYVDVLETLIQAGADHKFKARRGGWNHWTQYPLFSGVAYTLSKFKDEKEKIRFMQIFVKRGLDINQGQHHSRSKNWRGYNTSTCFIFQMMDGCGIRSKIQELARICEPIKFDQLSSEKEKFLREAFQKQFPQFAKQIEKQNQSQKKQEEKKKPQISFIEALINFGTNPNSSRRDSFWENYNSEMYYDQPQNYKEMVKFDEKIRQEYENILHRAIMNDLPSLVKLLLEKGAKVQSKLKITIRVPIYPHDWPEKIVQKRKQEVEQNLRSYQESKQQLKQKLKTTNNPEEKKKLENNLSYYEFSIFKAKKFAIENENPHPTYEVKELTCLQIAEKLNVSQETLVLVKDASSKVQVDEKKN